MQRPFATREDTTEAVSQPPPTRRPVVRVKPSSYQPSKAELDEDLSIPNVTAEDLARACLRSVTVIEEK